MKKIVFIIVSLLVVEFTFAQDVIIKKDSSVIKAKITEVKNTTIKYKKDNYIDGPVFQIKKNRLQRIEYANGDSSVFSHPFIMPKKSGLYIGLLASPGVSYDFKSGSEALFSSNAGIGVKYMFNENWGVKTGVISQYTIYQNENTENDSINDVYDTDNIDEQVENNQDDDNQDSDNQNGDNGNEDMSISTIGVPLHIVFTKGKRLSMNVEAGISYFYTLESPYNTASSFGKNYLLTAETILGGTYYITPKFSVDAGLFIQYDLVNYTGQTNNNSLFSGIQFGINYKLGK